MPARTSRKAILNITSRKKRDTMRPIAFTDPTAAGTFGAYNISAAFGLTVLGWVATARNNEVINAAPLVNGGTVFDSSTRTATSCFMRGLKECVEIQTSSGIPWQWRRICIKFRGPSLLRPNLAAGDLLPLWFEDTNGYARGMYSLTSGNAQAVAVFGNIQSVIFKGRLNIDYANFLTAPLDRSRVEVAYDKTFRVSSGNANGIMRRYNLWHGMNKTLVYDDDEVGGSMSEGFLSADTKGSMGDYYVFDFFVPGVGGTSTDVLRFDPETTLYWHER